MIWFLAFFVLMAAHMFSGVSIPRGKLKMRYLDIETADWLKFPNNGSFDDPMWTVKKFRKTYNKG